MARTDFAADTGNDSRDLRFVPADPARARTLSAEQVEGYNRDGFVSPVDVFDRAEADRFRAYIDDLLDQVVNAPDARNGYSVNSYHMVCAGLWDLIRTPRILDLVEDILGPDIVCWGQHLFAKLPGDPMAVPMHQDGIYWPLTPTRSVTVWLAIDDVTPDNGPMTFAPGSHLGGPLPHVERALDGTRVLKREVDPAADPGTRHANTLRAGQVSLHSDLLLHGSAVNTSARRRAGLTLRYAAAEVRTVPGAEWWMKPAVHCRGDIPDHWPHRRRPSGEHPERMADFFGDFDGNPVPDSA